MTRVPAPTNGGIKVSTASEERVLKRQTISLLLALLACEPADGGKSSSISRRIPSGTFFGASADGRAWLIFLDTARQWGSLDIPPRALELCELSQDSSGLSMRWAPGYEDVAYTFKGRWTGNELVGAIEGPLVRPEPRRTTETTPLRARRLSAPPAGVDSGRGGYYSNVVQTESGELGGTEFLFIDAPGQPVGVLTFYEGSAGEPLAAQQLVTDANNLRFKILRNGQEREFAVSFGKKGLTLSSPTLGGERLAKRATVAEVAHLVWEPGCQDSLRSK